MHGLEDLLVDELTQIGATNIQKSTRAVEFEGDKEVLYRANYELRTAIRILKPFYQFRARHENHLYKKVMEFDWSELLSVDRTLAIDSAVKSKYFTHSKYIALKTKDAIVDQFRNRTGRRPSIDIKNPDVRLNLHVFEDQCSISLDSSGDSLHKRGYRLNTVSAPINEILAAGMILTSGWDGSEAFFDPMCGSGTIAIEAAMMARNMPPQILRERFAFMGWKDFDSHLWQKVVENAQSKIRDIQVPIFAFDKDPQARHYTRKNAMLAGVEDFITLDRKDFFQITPPAEKGLIIMNPPYDERMPEEDIAAFYKDIGDHLKQTFAGWTAWMISSNKDALKSVGLRPSKKKTLYNGKLECKFQKFEMFAGKRIDHLIEKGKE